MDFAESTHYLFSLGNEVSAMKLGLDNIGKLLSALGDPQKKYLKVQVAGTNGKGSVCAFLGSICREAGVRAGIFTSPHLVSVTERIVTECKQIGEDTFAGVATRVRETAERMLASGELEYRPTFFEQITAIALTVFAEAGVDLAILETGLGGRLDATTAARAEIAAVTQIDFDHQEYLGETLAEITSEKAAIIRADSRVIIGDQGVDAEYLINKRLSALGVDGHFADHVRVTDSGGLRFETEHSAYDVPELGLKGRHQIENAKVALLVAEVLGESFPITGEHISAGLGNARHPGRLERQGRFLFDGAHNPAGAEALRAYLDESVEEPVTMIFGAMREKDIARIANTLFPSAKVLVLTQPQNSRAMTVAELSEYVPPEFDRGKVITTANVAEAIEAAGSATAENGVIVVTGSLYLVGEAKSLLGAGLENREFEPKINICTN